MGEREGRPSDDEILIGRLIDRSIRPLFPEGYKEEVQVMITLLSVDLENPPEIVAAIAASAALSISPIPWEGPIGIIKVGLKDDKFITNPKASEMTESKMDLVVSATRDAVIMIEAGAKEVPEKDILKGIEHAQKECQTVIDFINSLVKEAAKEKKAVHKEKVSLEIEKKVKELGLEKIKSLVKEMSGKEADYYSYNEAKSAIISNFEGSDAIRAAEIFDHLFKEELRTMILSGKRPDGRKLDEIRPLSAEVGVLPRTHGSAIFNRGQTQALTIATLGAPSLEQTIESAEGEETKRYIHHYSMPPYSTGETGRVGSPSRREIGHGALAERALIPVIPEEGEFPYTIRVVTEILSSNGSTSMASTCGSTLALMDAGVPIKTPVAGIAMGLIVEDKSTKKGQMEKYSILTDISGIEDGNGDMDFKIAGTESGITALQLDVKTLALTLPVLEKVLAGAKKGRSEILEVMKKVIAVPRESVSPYAPKIKIIKIDPGKIGDLIGSGGRTIKGIIAGTGAQVDVHDDGTVYVSSTDAESVAKAISQIEGITKDPVPGEIYEGTVKRIQPFGAFVEILPGKEGLVHISDMSQDFVNNPNDIVKFGERIKVRVKEIDDLGRLNLSMLLEGDKKSANGVGAGHSYGNYSRPQRPQRREMGRGGRDDRRGGRGFIRHEGPHFPTSRLLDDSRKKFDR